MGIREFREATDDVKKEIEEAFENGNPDEKLGGVVYEALTTSNTTVEFIYPRRFDFDEFPFSKINAEMKLFIAQGFGVGRILVAPGTFGSLAGILWFMLLLSGGKPWLYLAGACLGVGLSIWLCGAAEKILKQKDPSSVVLDEIVAMPFCFFAWIAIYFSQHRQLPAPEYFFRHETWLFTLVIFAGFRFFDIIKPWPVRQSQSLPGGWGVTVDDLLASVCVNVVSAVVLRFAPLAL